MLHHLTVQEIVRFGRFMLCNALCYHILQLVFEVLAQLFKIVSVRAHTWINT